VRPTRHGDWAGWIFIAAHRVKIQLVPNDNQTDPKAPAFRIVSGEAQLGSAWKQQSNGPNTYDFLSGEIEFAGQTEPISIVVFFKDAGTSARILWSRNI
jgi:uncharacterized protein (DUF736 family)